MKSSLLVRFSLLLLAAGCKGSLDPAFVDTLQKYSDATCACAKLPAAEQTACLDKVSPQPIPKGGLDGLSEEAVAKYDKYIKLAKDCRTTIETAAAERDRAAKEAAAQAEQKRTEEAAKKAAEEAKPAKASKPAKATKAKTGKHH
jgi:hypothetical protein